jgi:hypothetical protein
LHIFYRFCQNSVKQYTGPKDPMPHPEHNADVPLAFVALCLRKQSDIRHTSYDRIHAAANNGLHTVVGVTFTSFPNYASVVD